MYLYHNSKVHFVFHGVSSISLKTKLIDKNKPSLDKTEPIPFVCLW